VATQWLKKFDDMFIRVDTTHERHRHTNRQTPHDGMPRLCIASRGKNDCTLWEKYCSGMKTNAITLSAVCALNFCPRSVYLNVHVLLQITCNAANVYCRT